MPYVLRRFLTETPDVKLLGLGYKQWRLELIQSFDELLKQADENGESLWDADFIGDHSAYQDDSDPMGITPDVFWG
jgi:hypothetical protein